MEYNVGDYVEIVRTVDTSPGSPVDGLAGSIVEITNKEKNKNNPYYTYKIKIIELHEKTKGFFDPYMCQMRWESRLFIPAKLKEINCEEDDIIKILKGEENG